MKTSHSSPLGSPKGTPLASDLEPETSDLVNTMQQGQSNILVAVRCRPLTKKEKDLSNYKTVHILDNKLVIITDPSAASNKRTKEKKYAFDFAFGETIGQQEIFNKTTQFLLDGVLNGFNATVFAYGPTGAGKTYTMLGEVDKPGIMMMSFIELFSRIEVFSKEREYSVRISYLEIYNEIVRDLLNPSTNFLDIREDQEKGIVVSGLSELNATGPEEVIECLRLGNRRRTCEPTEANLTSSRSHAVLQILVEHKDRAEGISADIYYGKLSLIDLAGSERAANTKNRGIRLIEGANINRSLLALGNCINALYEANIKGVKAFIPYRDSKLTRLLKDSLGGKCRTVMIVCISPFHLFYEDTHNTLKYANRAKNIKTTTERNVVNVSYHITKYQNIIKHLQNEVKMLRNQIEKPKPIVIKHDESLEHYHRELEEHFFKENRAKNAAFEALNAYDELQTQILIRQHELINEKFKATPNTHTIQSLEDRIKKLNDSLSESELKINKFSQQSLAFESMRKEIEFKWQGLPELGLAGLRIQLQQLIIKQAEQENERRRIHDENILKQKDTYIQMLQDQLRERIENLETQESRKQSNFEIGKEPKVYQRGIDVETGNQKGKVFNYRLQGSKNKVAHLKSDSILPPISPKNHSQIAVNHSKIPRPSKFIDDSSSTSSNNEANLVHPNSSKNIYKNQSKIPRKKVLVSNSEPESSRNAELPKISDKFKQSPYVSRKQDTKKNMHSKRNIKYGVMIRGLERL